MLKKIIQNIVMDYFGIIEKSEFKGLINKAKANCVKEAIQKLKEFDPMNETFFRAAMPENTPEILIKKRTKKTNKLLLMKRAKELKRLLG